MASGRSTNGPQAMTARSSRSRASEPARGQSRRAWSRSSSSAVVAATHGDRVDRRIEAGLPEGDEVGLGAEEARRDVPAGACEGTLHRPARLRGGGHEADAWRRARCAPRGGTSPASPAASRPRRHPSARRARPGPRGATSARPTPARRRRRAAGSGLRRARRASPRCVTVPRSSVKNEGASWVTRDGSRPALFRRRGRPPPRAPRAGR